MRRMSKNGTKLKQLPNEQSRRGRQLQQQLLTNLLRLRHWQTWVYMAFQAIARSEPHTGSWHSNGILTSIRTEMLHWR